MTKLAAQQSDEQRALQAAIDARAAAFVHRDEKRDALSRTEQALVELERFLGNAQRDLEQEIAEASNSFGEGEIELLPEHAVASAERVTKLSNQIEIHRRVRDKLKHDLNEVAHSCLQAQTAVDHAKRLLLQVESAKLAEQIDALEERSSQLRDQLRGLTSASVDGLDCLSPRALLMMNGSLPPPPDDPQTNSLRWHMTRGWTAAYRAWRAALESDPSAKPPEAPASPEKAA